MYPTLHFYTLLYPSVHYCTLLYTTVHYCTLLYTTVHYCTLLYTSVNHLHFYYCTNCTVDGGCVPTADISMPSLLSELGRGGTINCLLRYHRQLGSLYYLLSTVCQKWKTYERTSNVCVKLFPAWVKFMPNCMLYVLSQKWEMLQFSVLLKFFLAFYKY